MSEPTLIFDCHAIGHAAKHGYHGLMYRGEPTGVIYGFLIKVLSLVDKFKTRRLVFAWDSGKRYRREVYPDYKKKDKEWTSEEAEENRIAKVQFGELRTHVLPSLGFKNIFIQTGLEADDIIASFVINNPGDNIVISDDQDLYQLLDHCNLFKIKSKKMYTREDLRKEWGVNPDGWIHVKRLSGCTGDNVPNIPGVKEKTAIKYLKGTLSPSRTLKINNFLADNPGFEDQNRKLTQLPFVGTKDYHFSEYPDNLNLMTVSQVCEWFGFSSLLKKGYWQTWEFLCER